MKELSMSTVAPAGLAAPRATKAPQGGLVGGFGEMLNQSIAAVNNQLGEADTLSQGLASGQHANIHETMIAVEQAGISFHLMTRVQQKVLDAYQEIMRMQL